jgi:hypothetical protein
MKQYKITSENFNEGAAESNDCVLPDNDPIHEMRVLAGLGGLGGQARLMEYRSKTTIRPENISHAAAETSKIQREKNIKSGTPEWFQLWFSLPYMTGEKKFGK